MNHIPVELSELGQIAFVVRDVAAATAFYRDVLGMRFLFSAGPNLAFFAAGSVRIMLTLPEGAGQPGQNSILYFKVRDIVATYEALVARGAVPASTPSLIAQLPDHELWLAGIRDPEGNVIELMEERRPSPSPI